jgi:predicted RNA binding protein YcfA (HicA-like mRNA interferase family)
VEFEILHSKHPAPRFAICIDNSEYSASLELHKVYRVLPDEEADLNGDLRIIDESGEDYLYPVDYFVLLDVLNLFNARYKVCERVKFNELVRLLEDNRFRIVKEKGSIRYYGKDGYDKLIRMDYHGSKEVPTGTCHAILKAAGIKN